MLEKKCHDCPAKFSITENEVVFYKSKGFPLPKRCVPCRQLRKNKNNVNANKPFESKLANLHEQKRREN